MRIFFDFCLHYSNYMLTFAAPFEGKSKEPEELREGRTLPALYC